MGSSVNVFPKRYMPFLLKHTAEAYQKLGDDEVVGFALYYSEKLRKKPGFFRRKGERIRAVVLAYYPLLAKPFSKETAVLIDPLKNTRLTIQYNVVDKDLLDSALRELSAMTGKNFLDGLVKLSRLAQDAASARSGVRKEIVELNNVVSDLGLLQGLKPLIGMETNYNIPFIEIPFPSVDHEEVARRISKAMREIDELIEYVNNVLEKVRGLLEAWKKEITKEYEEKLRIMDEKIEETKRAVAKAIEELKRKRDEELSSVKERHLPNIESIEKRIVETRENVIRLEEELEKAKAYGKDTSDLKKRLNDQKKTLKNLEKELENARASYDDDVKRIEKKYNELIEAENNKVKSILSERDAVRRELETLIQEAGKRFDAIRSGLQDYLEQLVNVEKKVEEISITAPSKSEELYLIPLVYTSYASEKTTRSIITTIVVLEPGGRLGPRFTPYIHEGIANYFSWVKQMLDKEDMAPEITSKNLLTNTTPERIEVCLTRLSEIGLLTREDASEMARRLEEQMKMSS